MAQPPSFKDDISKLFIQIDIDHMSGIIDLTSYDDVKANATAILGRLTSQDPRRVMPPPKERGGEGPWTSDKIDVFRAWIAGGCQR
jgi:hypothetical protein